MDKVWNIVMLFALPSINHGYPVVLTKPQAFFSWMELFANKPRLETVTPKVLLWQAIMAHQVHLTARFWQFWFLTTLVVTGANENRKASSSPNTNWAFLVTHTHTHQFEYFKYWRKWPVRRPAYSTCTRYGRLNTEILTSSSELAVSTAPRNSFTCSIEGGVKSSMGICTGVNGKPCKDGRLSVKEISCFTPLLQRNSMSARVEGRPRAANLPSTNHEKFLGGIAE